VRTWAFRLASLLLVAAVLLVLDRLLVWMPGFERPDYYDPGLAYNHPIHGYQSTPGAVGWYERADFRNLVRFNERGRHDRPVGEKHGPRIVALGGSFTAGLEVPIEETWPKRLEARLAAERGDRRDGDGAPWQVVNASHQAKRFDYFVRLLDAAWFDALEPDLLVFGFSYARLSPDPSYGPDEMACQRALSYRGFSILHGPGLDDEARALVDAQLAGLAPRLYEHAPWLRRSNIAAAMVRFEQRRLRAREPRYSRAIFNGNYVAVPGCDHPRSASNTRRHIETIERRARARGIPVTFAFIPPRSCYLGEDREDASVRIAEYFTRREDVLDLCADFRARHARDGHPLHWPADGHPNRAGYDLVAERLHVALRDRIRAIEARQRPRASTRAQGPRFETRRS
jgi:lysophospholipase L1-like esterase